MSLNVKSTVINGEGGLAQGFRQRRMRMATTGQIFAAGGEGNGHGSLGNQVARTRADDVHAENTVRLRIGQDFDAALRLSERAGAAVGEEWKYSPPIFHARFLQLLFGFTDRCDFRPGID